jgi:hypothetical protein
MMNQMSTATIKLLLPVRTGTGGRRTLVRSYRLSSKTQLFSLISKFTIAQSTDSSSRRNDKQEALLILHLTIIGVLQRVNTLPCHPEGTACPARREGICAL